MTVPRLIVLTMGNTNSREREEAAALPETRSNSQGGSMPRLLWIAPNNKQNDNAEKVEDTVQVFPFPSSITDYFVDPCDEKIVFEDFADSNMAAGSMAAVALPNETAKYFEARNFVGLELEESRETWVAFEFHFNKYATINQKRNGPKPTVRKGRSIAANCEFSDSPYDSFAIFMDVESEWTSVFWLLASAL